MKTAEEEDRKSFAILKFQIGQILVDKFLEYNEGKFHTGLEFNPPTHALTEFVESYSNQQLAEYKAKLKNEIAKKAITTDPLFQVAYLDVTLLIDSIN